MSHYLKLSILQRKKIFKFCYDGPKSSPICGEEFLDAVNGFLMTFRKNFNGFTNQSALSFSGFALVVDREKNNRALKWKTVFRHISAIHIIY